MQEPVWQLFVEIIVKKELDGSGPVWPPMTPRYSIDANGRRYAMKVQRPGLNRALAMDVVILNLGPVRKVAIWEGKKNETCHL